METRNLLAANGVMSSDGREQKPSHTGSASQAALATLRCRRAAADADEDG
jgi:hypothetical protein